MLHLVEAGNELLEHVLGNRKLVQVEALAQCVDLQVCVGRATGGVQDLVGVTTRMPIMKISIALTICSLIRAYLR